MIDDTKKYGNAFGTSGEYTLTYADKTVTIDNWPTYQDNFTFNFDNTDNEGALSIGKQTLNEEDIEDLFALLNVIKNLDKENPIRQSFYREKVKNKLKGE
tara:strand:+ start:16606 stop:16905 length:300 start_codon:yes stop_codon:yes gene_type:complete